MMDLLNQFKGTLSKGLCCFEPAFAKKHNYLKQFSSKHVLSSMISRRAFTLVELLVVIAILGILAAMLLPVLSHAKQRAQGAYCLNNAKQLMVAMHLYTSDNHDFYPPNPDDGNNAPGYNWCSGSAGVGQSDEFNPDIIADPTRSLLIGYLSGQIALFHCPSDTRQGTYEGTNAALIGHTVPAARTFSMSQAVGTIDPGFNNSEFSGASDVHSGIPNMSVNGPWLDNSDQHHRNTPWRTFGKMSDAGPPSPADLWVLVDEAAQGLNDAAFAVDMTVPGWHDYPGTYHNFGCGFAFADGHAETHQWHDGTTRFGNGDVGSGSSNPSDWRDWEWVTSHTSARVQ
jgi:prepilin-type N-terminal cleavage/methylation domain-containing protein/prepilin-type processing-associated H-X9-DG protein